MNGLEGKEFEGQFMGERMYLDVIMPLNHHEDMNTDSVLMILQAIYDMHMKIFEVFSEEEAKIPHFIQVIEQDSLLSDLLHRVTKHPNIEVQSLVFRILDECVLFHDPLYY